LNIYQRDIYSIFFGFLILAQTSVAQDNYQESIHAWNTPDWVKQIFVKKKLDKRYSFSYQLNPFYLRGDFNGDGKIDIAILIEEIKTGKKGIAVCHAGKDEVFILGAGNTIGNGGEDFKWMDIWEVYPKGLVHEGSDEATIPTLVGDALFVEKSESASGLIYWNRKSYAWYQQGD